MKNSNTSNYSEATHELEQLLEVTARLRAPDGGCVWNIAQTHASLKKYLLEETYEVLQAIDDGQSSELEEELGDLLFQVCLHAQIASEADNFDFAKVAAHVKRKMLLRHPHVFEKGMADSNNLEDIAKQWEAIKAQEKATKAEADSESSPFSSIPATLPSLARAVKVLKKAGKLGLTVKPILLSESGQQSISEISQPLELQNLLMALASRCVELKLDPEELLRQATLQLQQRLELQYKNQQQLQ